MTGAFKQIQAFWQALSHRQWPRSLDEQEAELVGLPPGVLQALRDKLGGLPTPQPYCDVIRQELRQGVQRWQGSPTTASNCAVVLSRPVEDVVTIVKDSVHDYFQDFDVHFLLSGYRRHPDPLQIVEHLRQELDPIDESDIGAEVPAPVTQDDIKDDMPTLIVIPSLEQLFLRCIQGWSGVEYLQTFCTQNESIFWVFGCNHWAWTFLDKVCQISAYIEQVIPLPKLDKDDLQTWLQPLLETAIATQDNDHVMLQVDSGRSHYWSTLASLSSGIGISAAHLWLESLQVDPDVLTEQGTLPADSDAVHLVEAQPSRPSLMSLEPLDRHILHSLLIHHEMTRSHLALSLGENERTTRSRVQVLRREGILHQRGRRLSVHPAHYPKIYRELSDNNFLIGEA